MKTNDLIEKLAKEAKPAAPLRSAGYYAARLVLVLLAYGGVTQFFLHLRADLVSQLGRPAYSFEIALLATLTLISAIAAAAAMYPDVQRRAWLLNLPYIVFAALFSFVLFQLVAMPVDPRMVIPPPGGHELACTMCIASVSVIPSALVFFLIRRGATVHPLRAGSFAVLAATGIGCLTLRLSEANDSLAHLATWHYLPTLLFAILGAALGKWLLKW